MSTLNQAIFNRSPFNLGQTNTVIWVNAEGNEYVERSVGYSRKVYVYPTFNEKVRKSVYVTASLASLTGIARELIGWQTDLVGEFWKEVRFSEQLTSDIVPSRLLYLDIDSVEHWETQFSAGRQYRPFYDLEAAETIDLEYIPYYEIWLDVPSIELVSQVTGVEATEETACLIDVTLEPGDLLVVDAANFSVLLNGENIVHLHSGDWLDALKRNTSAITIQAETGNGNLSAAIRYTEQYL